MIKLSIIVPVYNVEPWLERCLRSLMEQDITNDEYEIIVVNDGSPDNSREIVLRLQKEASNIILIDQENQGVSVARNAGIKNAKGKYILAIDPDDYVEKKTLAAFIKVAENKDLDLLYLGFEEWDINGNFNEKNNYKHLQGKIFSGTETYLLTRGQKLRTPDRSCGILYNRQLIQDYSLEYTADIPYLEDGHFVGKVLCLARRCAFLDYPFYKYIKRPASSSTSQRGKTLKGIQGYIVAANDLEQFKIKHTFSNEQIGLANHLSAKFVLTAVMAAIGTKQMANLRWVIATLKKNGHRHLETVGLFETKNYARIYNFSVWLFAIYYVVETRFLILAKWMRRKS